MARMYILSLKIINLALFSWLFITFLTSIFHFDTVVVTADNEFVLFAFLGALKAKEQKCGSEAGVDRPEQR